MGSVNGVYVRNEADRICERAVGPGRKPNNIPFWFVSVATCTGAAARIYIGLNVVWSIPASGIWPDFPC